MRNLAAALVIITGLLIMVAACLVPILSADLEKFDFFWVGLMFIVGLGATLGGSEMNPR